MKKAEFETFTTKISELNLKELQEVVDTASSRIVEVRDAERAHVADQVNEFIRKAGFEPTEFLRGGTVGKMAPKYRDPHNEVNTWAGRGKKPAWLQKYIEQGQALDDFLIMKPSKAA